MSKPIELSGEIIPVQLIGQNRVYEILKKPLDLKFPWGDEVRCSDDYINRLNELHNLDDVLGEKIVKIKDRQVPLGRIYQRNMQGAEIIMYLLEQSIQSGTWHPFIIDYDHYRGHGNARRNLEFVQHDELNTRTLWVYGMSLFGIELLRRDEGFLSPIDHKNKIIAIPTQSFINYVAQQKDSF